MTSTPKWFCMAASAAVLTVACTGVITDPGSKPEQSAAPLDCSSKAVKPGKAPLRRLTHREFDNTIRDLLGDESALGSSFTPDAQSLGFDNMADTQAVSPLLAEQYEKAAIDISTRA